MNILNAANPVYSTPNKVTIDTVVTFDDGQVLPYTAMAFDSTDYGQQLWIDLNAGKWGPIGDYVPPVPPSE